MTGPQRCRALVALAAMLALVCGCFPDPGSVAPAQSDAAGRGIGVATAFAERGIAVIDDVANDWPEGALMASPASAVAAMQAEVDSGGGLAGFDLDELVPMPEGAVPFSFLIAAWLSETMTSRAEVARAWMPQNADWSRAQSLWYPRAALLLFVADAMEASISDFGDARASASASAGAAASIHSGGIVRAAASTVPGARQGTLAAPCSAVAGFFSRMIDDVFSAVQLPPDFLAKGGVLGAISGFLASLYNSAVALAKQAVLAVIETLTAPILRAIGSAVAIVGLVSHLSTYVLGISLTVSTDRPVLLDGREGEWTAFVNANRPLEPQLTDCLAALGQRPLNKMIQPGSTVTWHRMIPTKADGSVFGRVTLLYTTLTSTVDDREVAVLPWLSAKDIESSQPEQIGQLGVRAELPKGDVARLLTAARTLLNQAIADIAVQAGPLSRQVDAAIKGILAPAIDRIEAEILGTGRSLLMIVGSGVTPFVYREPDPPAGPAGAPTADCFVGTWRFERLVSSNWIEFSQAGFRRFTLEIGADGSYAVTVRGVVSTFSAEYEGATTFSAGVAAGGTWAVTAPPLTTRSTGERFGEVVFGQGLSPTVFSCSADGATLTVTGHPDKDYGSTVWRFRRG